VSGTYQAIISTIFFSSPGFSVKGTKREAPGASFSTGATAFTCPFSILFQAMEKGSHHPPRNQQ